ncbi:recombination protein RecR, partial [Candidatus Curtissbacteria bacterium RIFCSPHIGHO2_01_FULL_40_12]
NITEVDPCEVCEDPSRDQSIICVVEDPLDVWAIEKSGSFNGIYHVLHGVIAPLDNIGPEELKISELLKRLKGHEIRELIMATNPSMEGEATAMYIQRLIKPLGLKITRIARGIPIGAEIEYADEVTVRRALEGRKEY